MTCKQPIHLTDGGSKEGFMYYSLSLPDSQFLCCAILSHFTCVEGYAMLSTVTPTMSCIHLDYKMMTSLTYCQLESMSVYISHGGNWDQHEGYVPLK